MSEKVLLISISFKQQMWSNCMVLVFLLARAGCDRGKAHLHITAEIKGGNRRFILERRCTHFKSVFLFIKWKQDAQSCHVSGSVHKCEH